MAPRQSMAASRKENIDIAVRALGVLRRSLSTVPGGGELIPFMDRTQIIFTSFIKNLRYIVNGYMSFFNKNKMYKIIIKSGKKTLSA